MSLTIVEGPDGAGKTTLAREWSNATHHHQRPYVSNVLTETLAALALGLVRSDHLICDRLHLGERIYGPVYRGLDMLGDDGQRVLERAILGLGQVAQVICYPPFEPYVKEAWLKNQEYEMLDNLQQLEMVYTRYKTQRSMLPTLVYDWTKRSVSWLIAELDAIRSPLNPGPGVGWFDETAILVVGEQCNPNKPGTLLPFVCQDDCSGWLSRRLGTVDERWLYWVNALTPGGKKEDPSFIENLRPRGIIALGAVASRWLREAGYDHERLDHPQYHKRFRHHDIYPLQGIIHDLRSR